ncbi:MAG TPA: universal stress protein [Polyangiaceae bacterium]|jgi:nucleotide-binding universal stress UspA family protein
MRILVATDLSDGSDLALREAKSCAHSKEDTFAVLHLVPALPSVHMLFPRAYAKQAAALQTLLARARDLLRERVARTLGSGVDIFVAAGSDYAEVVRRAELWKADRVVISSRGTSGFARVLGDVADRVVRSAGCSVLVVRQPSVAGPVLVATDLSSASLPAVVQGAEEARRREASLIVVHAIGFLDIEAAHLLKGDIGNLAPSAFEVSQHALVTVVRKLNVEATCRVLERPAAAAILREAETVRAQLVVVGAHRRGAPWRWATGRVMERVLHVARSSVLVAKAPRANA